MDNEYYKYMEEFLNYFEDIVKKYCENNVEMHLSTIDRHKKSLKEDLGNCHLIEESTNIIHQHLYRKKNINFINYWHYQRCKECNLPIPT